MSANNNLYKIIISEEITAGKPELLSMKSSFTTPRDGEQCISPYQVSHISYLNSISPLYTPRQQSKPLVFERLISDTNRRIECEIQMNNYKQILEEKLVKRYTENEEVYGRLILDAQVRKENSALRDRYKKQVQSSKEIIFQGKKGTKEQVDTIVNRLVQKSFGETKESVGQEKRNTEKKLDVNSLILKVKAERKKKEESKVGIGLKEILKEASGVDETQRMGIIERMEIEKVYGKPGQPNKDYECKRFIRKKSKSSSRDLSKSSSLKTSICTPCSTSRSHCSPKFTFY